MMVVVVMVVVVSDGGDGLQGSVEIWMWSAGV